ncbi:transcriptional repressor TCF25-domain-containing protein [Salix suchowensis]|nr:transcriptional repressor TCF25-domain-containing protein [Salix suchowensis]
MPPRLNKRQQRELEELEALRAIPSNEPTNGRDDLEREGDGSDDDPEMKVPPRVRASTTRFSAAKRGRCGSRCCQVRKEGGSSSTRPLGDTRSHEANSGVVQNKNKKKKKPAGAVTVATSASTPAIPTSQSKSEKKAEKKARTKEKKADKDELDQALADLSLKYVTYVPYPPPYSSIIAASQIPGTPKTRRYTNIARREWEHWRLRPLLSPLLAVSTAHLDAEGEMRKFFGAKVVQASKSSSPLRPVPAEPPQPVPQRGQCSRARRRRGGPPSCARASQSAPDGRRVGGEGGRHQWEDGPGRGGGRWSTARSIRVLRWRSCDGSVWVLCIITTDQYRIRTGRRLRRPRAVHLRTIFVGAFSFTNGMNRLDFDYSRTGRFSSPCTDKPPTPGLRPNGVRVRAPPVVARSMEDPHGALFHLDFLALKAGMGAGCSRCTISTLRNKLFTRIFEDRKTIRAAEPDCAAGWLYARALALRYDEDGGRIKHAKGARRRCGSRDILPVVVPLLADKIDAAIPDSVRATWISGYRQRQPAHTQFLATFASRALRFSVYRHTVVLEATHRRLLRSYRRMFGCEVVACDPLPPPTAVTEYTEGFSGERGCVLGEASQPAAARGGRTQTGEDDSRCGVPPAAPIVGQAFFDGNPNIAEQFPGGVVQFAQNAARLPPDVLEGMMIAELNAQGGQGGHGEAEAEAEGDAWGMPGVDMGDGREEWGGAEGGGFDEGMRERREREGKERKIARRKISL